MTTTRYIPLGGVPSTTVVTFRLTDDELAALDRVLQRLVLHQTLGRWGRYTRTAALRTLLARVDDRGLVRAH